MEDYRLDYGDNTTTIGSIRQPVEAARLVVGPMSPIELPAIVVKPVMWPWLIILVVVLVVLLWLELVGPIVVALLVLWLMWSWYHPDHIVVELVLPGMQSQMVIIAYCWWITEDQHDMSYIVRLSCKRSGRHIVESAGEGCNVMAMMGIRIVRQLTLCVGVIWFWLPKQSTS